MRRLWTIGYEGRTVANLVATLRDAGIQRVVDIRELPLSRRPGFSKRGLADGLARAGIEYAHLKALGTPRAVRHAYKAGGSYEAFRDAYLEHLRGQREAIDELLSMVAAQRVAVLCVEKDAAVCHRGVLAARLRRRGVEATHL